MEERPVILSIAGYDPSSGAGVTADVKTAAALDCYAVTCVTALTVQTTQGVFGTEPVPPQVVRETLRRLAEDVKIAAVRVGMLGSSEVVCTVAEFLTHTGLPHVVSDPVLRSSSGAELIDREGIGLIRTQLFPLSDVITPNLAEAAELAEIAMDGSERADSYDEALRMMRLAAGKLHGLGCRAVLITGGHLAEANDYLSIRDGGITTEKIFPGKHLESKATHGTGCAFATALACELAHGRSLVEALGGAKEYVRQAISSADTVGRGVGPLNHLFRLANRE